MKPIYFAFSDFFLLQEHFSENLRKIIFKLLRATTVKRNDNQILYKIIYKKCLNISIDTYIGVNKINKVLARNVVIRGRSIMCLRPVSIYENSSRSYYIAIILRVLALITNTKIL